MMPTAQVVAGAAWVFAIGAGTLAATAALKPVDVAGFLVEPGREATLRWRHVADGPAGPLAYTVRDYWGKVVATGRAQAAADGTVEVTVTLPRGFHDVQFPATKQRFGVVSLPAHRGRADAFFCIDGAMSWLVKADDVREGLVEVLRRSGVAMSRERVSWAQISPAADRWDFQTPQRYDRLRRTHGRHGIEVLEMFHDAPGHLGRVGKYPEDLAGAGRAWETIAKQWRTTWGALEVWNEPDIFFGANLPADQYVPLVQAVAVALARRRVRTPLVGGVMAHYNRRFLDCAAANGMLAWLNAASFHTYGRAPQMEGLIGHYRSWLRAHGAESMPLWLTECGRPWKKGPARPPADQDAVSALDITMKAVESRACGIARYFAFVYPFYEEGRNNFGMMGRAATPLRSFAAYARATSLLSGKDYLGDLRCADATIRRARVFGDANETVAVLYTEQVDAKAAVKLPLPARRAEGIDGRRLAPADPAAVPVPDGLTYVWLDRAKLGKHLRTDGPAMRLWKIARRPPPKRTVPSPILLRYAFDPAAVHAGSDGYRLKGKVPQALALTVKAFNLSAGARRLTLTASFSAAGAKLLDGPARDVRVPAGGSVGAVWKADLRKAFAEFGWVTFRVTAAGDDGKPLARLSVDLQGEAPLAWSLAGRKRRLRLPVHHLSRWTPNIAGHGRMTVEKTPEGHWRLTAEFGEGDPWVYPIFRLPTGVSLKGSRELLLRARCHAPADVRVLLWEGRTGVAYLTASSIIPADDKWHTAVVRFEDLTLSVANAPDPNHRLDLEKVRRISIGLNSKARNKKNTLLVSDLYLVSGK